MKHDDSGVVVVVFLLARDLSTQSTEFKLLGAHSHRVHT